MLTAATLAFALTIGGVEGQSPYPRIEAMMQERECSEAIEQVEQTSARQQEMIAEANKPMSRAREIIEKRRKP